MQKVVASILISIMFSIGAWNDAYMHRKGFLLVEVAAATITVQEGGGKLGGYDDAKGWYASYSESEGFRMRDKVLSIYIYDPCTNMVDDVLLRFDHLIERP